MTPDQHAWLKLVEECSETQQRVMKLIQFGPDEKEPGQNLTNLERVALEYADIEAAVFRLINRGQFMPLGGGAIASHMVTKDAKVEKYLALSIHLGHVTEAREGLGEQT